jgi:hypothetical protein
LGNEIAQLDDGIAGYLPMSWLSLHNLDIGWDDSLAESLLYVHKQQHILIVKSLYVCMYWWCDDGDDDDEFSYWW